MHGHGPPTPPSQPMPPIFLVGKRVKVPASSRRFTSTYRAWSLTDGESRAGLQHSTPRRERDRMTSGSKSLPTLGFLTVVEHAEMGWTGGYLVLNLLGRPLEFHCTAPVKPNRAQEILYGTTLRDFLCGEQIGQTLLEKSHFHPLFVCTDLESVMSVRESVKMPVALLVQADLERRGQALGMHGESRQGTETATTTNNARGELGHGGDRISTAGLEPLTCHGGHQLKVSARYPADEARLREIWDPEWSDFDFSEPFERIRDAISEAQRAA